MIRLLLAATLLASPLWAQQGGTIEVLPLEEEDFQVPGAPEGDDGIEVPPDIRLLTDEDFQTFEQETRVQASAGGTLRVLDKMTGDVETMEMQIGEARNFGFLTIGLDECRYPIESPSSDAFAHLTILPVTGGKVLFEGWMVASSPALMALDHPRYDVWVLRCKYDGPTPEIADGTRSPRPKARP